MAVDLIARAMATKGGSGAQEKLESGKNIKTIGGESILGPGDIPLYTGDVVPANYKVGMPLNISKINWEEILTNYTDGSLLYVVPKSINLIQFGGLYTGYSVNLGQGVIETSYVHSVPLTTINGNNMCGSVKIIYKTNTVPKVNSLLCNIFTDKYPTITNNDDTNTFNNLNFDFYIIK